MRKEKVIQRGLDIITNALRSFLPSIITILLSLLIIKFFSENLWGSFVKYNIYILSSGVVCSLGHKDFLLKEFSKSPSQIKALFNTSFTSRLPFLLATMLMVVFIFPMPLLVSSAVLLMSVYLCNSINTFLIYERVFAKPIIIELIVFTFFVVLILVFKPTTIFHLFNLYAIQFCIKAIMYALLVKNKLFRASLLRFSKVYIKKSIPFFLISLIGFANTKVDLFLVIYFERNETIALYQIITNFFIIIQSFSIIISLPFIKFIYRVKYSSLVKIEKFIRLYAPLLIVVGLLLTYLTMEYIYGFSFGILFYLFGFLIILPSYWLLVRYFVLYKKGCEHIIVNISLISTAINFIASFFLLKLGYGMLGAITGSVLASLATLLMFLTKKVRYINEHK